MKRRWMGIGMAVVVCMAGGAHGGTLDSPAGPTEPGSAMYRLEDVYNRLDTGAPGAPSVFAEPGAGPGSTGHTLNEVMGKAPATNAYGAAASDVLSGKVYWGLTPGAWGQRLGTRPGAPVPKTGAGDLPSYAEAAGEDGHASMRKGATWPDPRFWQNGDGTVTDNLSGLIWLTQANHIKEDYPSFDADGTAGDGAVTWQHALDFVAGMNAGTYGNCGYTDWRLPNVRELQSLIDYGCGGPNTALPANRPFVGMSQWYYWSSTTYAADTTYAWLMSLYDGGIGAGGKGAAYYVWPVRGGQ